MIKINEWTVKVNNYKEGDTIISITNSKIMIELWFTVKSIAINIHSLIEEKKIFSKLIDR